MEVNIETHGKGEFGAAGRDQTRPDAHPSTPQEKGTAPQIKTHPGHSICVPLPSSLNRILYIDCFISIFKDHIRDLLQQMQKSTTVFIFLFVCLRGCREEGAPTRTYPDQREQSWASIYTCLPLGSPSQVGLVVILHKRNR